MVKVEGGGRPINHETESLHASILEACGDPVYFCTPDRIIREANDAYARLNGFTRDQVLGRTVREIAGEGVYGHRAERLARAFAGESIDFQDWVEVPGIGRRFYDVRYQPVRDARGELIGVAAFGRDITGMKETDEALRLYGSIVLQMSDRISVFDREFRFLFVNESNARWYGLPREEMVGHYLYDLVGVERFERELRPSLERCFSGETVDLDLLTRKPDGREVIWSIRLEPFRNDAGAVDAAMVMSRDVTETRRLAHRLERLTLEDDLTGIANRRAFEQWLGNRLAALDPRTALDGGQGFGVVFLDLDGFKLVNDTAGHGAGDRFLVGVADCISAFSGSAVHVARIGGDEFGMIVDSDDSVAVKVLCERVLADLNDFHFAVDGMTFRGGASVGFTMVRPEEVFPAGGRDISRVLQLADQACLAAKAAGGRRVVQLSANAEIAQRQRDELRHLTVIEKALSDGAFHLEQMPVVALDGGGTAFHEVLMRLALPDGTLAGPNMISAVAERHGRTSELDTWLVTAVLERLCANRDARDCVSMNLSGSAICDERFGAFLGDRLGDNRDLAGRLIIELGEADLVQLDNAAWILLRHLRRLGVRVALDGFGRGFGVVTQVRDGIFDFIKIDRLLVADLADEPVNRAAVTGVVALARTLGLPTVAEHVSDAAALPVLRELGVHYAQGKAVRPARAWPLADG
ncbi:MAG: hypothetical protein CMN87_00715 [Stappia sp.]|uniref:GGDEF and EAL domain-containing protein n=1 Tax=Stappia sp. TaxID=1870903 RepID=UPI000C524D93|nr:GGDEF and EAL domain-containing protein [Stappia sp.]MAA97337.1 hypothetical protein [Stappia sp.]MBM18506.1 hypothetical protein [Stappia sp.]